jgi:hypothetical protein
VSEEIISQGDGELLIIEELNGLLNIRCRSDNQRLRILQYLTERIRSQAFEPELSMPIQPPKEPGA